MRPLLAALGRRATKEPARGHRRLASLTAALTGEPGLILDGGTARERRLADAARAEIGGDAAKAATILRELVDDPSASWDYGERAALLRVMRSLRRTADAAALCADTVRPAIYRPALIAMQRACR